MTLSLDVGALRDLGADLTLVSREFTAATQRSDRAADAVGHAALAEAIRTFATSWDDAREKMGGDLDMLAQFTSGIAEAFESIDTQLAAALTAPPPAPATPAPAHPDVV